MSPCSQNARPDVEKIIVPIVHEMHASNKNDIPAAAEAIKDSCTSIIGKLLLSETIVYTMKIIITTQTGHPKCQG